MRASLIIGLASKDAGFIPLMTGDQIFFQHYFEGINSSMPDKYTSFVSVNLTGW